MELGYIIVPYTFAEVTSKLCASVDRFFDVISDHEAATGFGKADVPDKCVEQVGHTGVVGKDKVKLTLADRVGAEIAGNFTKQLTGTPHEWMLDLSSPGLGTAALAEEWREECPMFTVTMDKLGEYMKVQSAAE